MFDFCTQWLQVLNYNCPTNSDLLFTAKAKLFWLLNKKVACFFRISQPFHHPTNVYDTFLTFVMRKDDVTIYHLTFMPFRRDLLWFDVFLPSSWCQLLVPEEGCNVSLCHTMEIWATTWQNQQNECEPSEDSDQPRHPPSLIRVFAGRSKGSWGPKISSCGQRRLRSDWADAQADLSLRWAHTYFVGFVMSRLIYSLCP